jgi:peptidoglycan/LPS O-acetylase OafA/YrhL
VGVPGAQARLAGIEGLRALAASAVLLSHVWLIATPEGPVQLGAISRHLFPHLPLGVTLFFALSGFLLYRPYAAAVLRGEPLPDATRYARNRFLRIAPAYWAVLLITGLVFHVAVIRPLPNLELGSLLERPVVLGADLLLVQNYAPPTITTGLGVTWSLAVELVFYAALPFLGLLAARAARGQAERRGRRIALLWPLLVLAGIGLLGKLVAALVVPGLGPGNGWVADWHSVIERSFVANADLFIFGMLLAIVRVDVEDGMVHVRSWWPVAAIAIAGTIALPTALALTTGHLHHYVYDVLMAASIALVLSTVVLPRADRSAGTLTRTLDSVPFVLTGLVSYSIFLWNAPVAYWLERHGMTFSGRLGFALNIALVGGATALLSTLTYRFVERPALRRKSPRPTTTSERDLASAQREAAP